MYHNLGWMFFMGSCDDRRLHLHYIIVFVADKVLVDGEPSDIGYVLPHVTCSSLVLWTRTFSRFLHAALEIDCMFWRGAKFQQHIIRQVNRYVCVISGTQFGHHFIIMRMTSSHIQSWNRNRAARTGAWVDVRAHQENKSYSTCKRAFWFQTGLDRMLP